MNDTETKPAPLAWDGINDRYQQLAPCPKPSSETPAWDLSRHLLVYAQRGVTPCWPRDAAGVAMLQAALAEFAALHLLRWIGEHRPGAADRLSCEIADAWADGGGVGERLWEHAQGLGIDPVEIDSLATAESRLRAAQAASEAKAAAGAKAEIETAAREMARKLAAAQQALALATEAHKCLGDLTESQAMVQYAAWIDLHRGDPESAKALLAEHIAGLPDGKLPWNGTDTGRQWLEKATAAQQEEAAADAEVKQEPVKM